MKRYQKKKKTNFNSEKQSTKKLLSDERRIEEREKFCSIFLRINKMRQKEKEEKK